MIEKREAWLLLGDTMRTLRRHAGVSLAAAASEVGASKGHLSQVERGRDRPSHTLVSRYDECFGGDGLLDSLYLTARAPMIEGRPLRAVPTGHSAYSRCPPPEAGVGIHGERSKFIADVTLPDGSLVTVGAELTKTWRLENAGAAPWIRMRLVRVGPCDGMGVLASPPSVPIPTTGPGEQVDISVSLRAPLTPGTSIAIWKMVDEGGQLVFPDLRDGLYVLVTAIEE
jgi:transcriptional regulator with XRE-family HTH domain